VDEPGLTDQAVPTALLDEPVLSGRDISAGYGALAAVRDVTIEVGRGEIVALLGANGAGKTTTLLALMGECTMFSGEVRFNGIRIDGWPLHRRARRGLAFVSEERSVFMGMSVLDNLKLGAGSVEPAVDICPELGRLLKRRAGLLSGGEQQMLTLARTLAAEPKALLIDELSLGLAPQITARLFGVLRSAVEREGIGVLLVEQQARRALAAVDRAYVLRRGEIVLEGRGVDLAQRHAEVETMYLTS
jgi:branched-chain amino acid transport system ATP-binding protein